MATNAQAEAYAKRIAALEQQNAEMRAALWLATKNIEYLKESEGWPENAEWLGPWIESINDTAKLVLADTRPPK